MKRVWKKRVAMLLTAIFLLSPFEWITTTNVEAASQKPPSTINGFANKCGYNTIADGQIPSHIPPCSEPKDGKGSGYKFNSDFYYRQTWVISRDPNTNAAVKTRGQRYLIVYGTPDDIPSHIQDFKSGWQDENTKVYPNEGHFSAYDYRTGGYTRGEYRFLGYDETGSLYPNDYFIRDDSTSTPLEKKHWVIHPWRDLPDSYIYKPGGPGPAYGDERNNLTQEAFANILANIVRSMDFEVLQGVKYSNRYSVLPTSDPENIDFRNFMNIPQNPTVWEPGIGMMYHYSWVSHSLWYQSFPLLKLEGTEKRQPPASCVVTPVKEGGIPLGKERYIDVEVKLVGTLEDEKYHDNIVMENRYYTRKDIASWKLHVTDKETNKLITLDSKVKSDGVIMKDNQATGIFKLRIDTQKVTEASDGTKEFKTTARVNLYNGNHTESKPSQASANCDLVIPLDGDKASMKSDFAVTPRIQFQKRSEFTKQQVGYQDFSYGKDADYYEFEITNADDGTKSTRTFDPAIPEVKAPTPGYLDQAAVEAYLYDFMKSKFSETSNQRVVKTFHIKQTIVDKDVATNNKSTATQTIVVVQNAAALTCEMLPSPPQYISPEADWPLNWYDVVPFPVTDAPPGYIPSKSCEEPARYNDFAKRVYIDGIEIDAERFFNGQFIFGEDRIGLRQVKTTFTAPDGTESFKIQHVVIHESKPRVSIRLEGLYKQNRTMRAYDQSAASNDQWVEQNAPLEITSFSYVDPTDPGLKCREGYCESNLSEKMFMYKETGRYKISIAAKRVIPYGNGQSITRYSDPYVVEYEIMPDHTPAIIAHAYANQISRLDDLKLFYDVVSTDGDYIVEKSLRVYHDRDNDGTFDTLVYETDGDITAIPKMDKLGQYKIEAYAKEGTDEERLMEFIVPEDDKEKTIETYFFIDNFAPASTMYMDIPIEMPDMDVYWMLDSNLKQASTDYIRNNRVSITNAFTRANMLANLDIWDMRTYTYTQSASTSNHTGTSYPSSSIYYSSNGYSGTLSLSSASNAPYSVDEGRFVTVTDSKTASDSCTNTVRAYYTDDGEYKSTSTTVCPSSKSYNDGKYRGTLDRKGESTNDSCPPDFGRPGSSCTRTYRATYSGTVYWTRDEWVPRMVEYDSWTGFYSGTISKSVRQPYDASFMRPVPNKYVVYVSDNKASQLADLQNVMSKHDAKLILVGHSEFQSQIGHEKFIVNDKPIEDVVGEVIAYIAESNPETPRRLILVGEETITRTAYFDWEDDPVQEDLLQIVHDPYYYDNSEGFGQFNGQTLASEKLNANWQPYQSAVTFQKPGKYMLFRKTKDWPSDDPNFEHYAYYSNESAVEVLVHRKPIPDVWLDFDYMTDSNRYRTTWVDMSYDLDHNVTRAATDRGIQARSIKLTNRGTGEVYTRIPESVPPGTYLLEYIVQDIEGVWSDPLQRTYVLPSAVPVQMKSNLKTAYDGFSLNGVPASESLIAYELWTRYPYAIQLQFAMGSYISRTVPYYTGVKTGNDISWADETFVIPNTTPDGTYTFTVRGNGSVAGSTAAHTYTVRVATPIRLSGRIDAVDSPAQHLTSLVVGDSYKLKADTTKYPDAAVNGNAVSVTMFKGTAYQRTVNLTSATIRTTGYGLKDWSAAFTVGPMPDGRYTFEWRARTPNGNTKTVAQTVEIVNNRPPTADFDWSPQPVYEGDTVAFSSKIDDQDGDELTVQYELTAPSGGRHVFDYVFNRPYPATAPVHRMTETGDWRMKLTVSDGRADPVTAEKTIRVYPLTVSGEVNHTDQWNRRRMDYNLKQSGDAETPRGYNVFWAGEKFMLVSNTTATETATKAERVEAVFGSRRLELKKADGSGTAWTGELWEEGFEQELKDGPYRFVFTAYYNNGTVKTTEVAIEIKGTVSQIAGVHRVK